MHINATRKKEVQFAAAYTFLSPHAVCHQQFLVDLKSFPATNLLRFVQPKDGHSDQIQHPYSREHKTKYVICIVQEIKKARWPAKIALDPRLDQRLSVKTNRKVSFQFSYIPLQRYPCK